MALQFEDLTGKIIGAAIEAHKELGPGFLEVAYEKALVLELLQRGETGHGTKLREPFPGFLGSLEEGRPFVTSFGPVTPQMAAVLPWAVLSHLLRYLAMARGEENRMAA